MIFDKGNDCYPDSQTVWHMSNHQFGFHEETYAKNPTIPLGFNESVRY